MKKNHILLLLVSMLTITVSAQSIKTPLGFVSADGQAGNVSYSYGQLFSHQTRAHDGTEVVAGVQQAQLLREIIDTALCQNDVQPIAGFDFHSVDASGNLIPAGQYDSSHYCQSFQNYDSITEITLTVWPIYELYDTIRLNYDELASRGFKPGRNDELLSNENDCDSLIHYMVYVCGFPDVVDGDGNNYDNLWLGYECWTQSNMHTTHYTDGTEVPNMIYRSEMFPNEEQNLNTYGRLYTWPSAVRLPEGSISFPPCTNDSVHFVQGICPDGWHIPTVQNTDLLAEYITDMLMSDSLWLIPGNNETGFDSRPAGLFNPANNRFENLLGYTHYWTDDSVSETTARARTIFKGCFEIVSENRNRQQGLSVRCVKDNNYTDTQWSKSLRRSPIK